MSTKTKKQRIGENNVPIRRHRDFEIAISPDRSKKM